MSKKQFDDQFTKSQSFKEPIPTLMTKKPLLSQGFAPWRKIKKTLYSKRKENNKIEDSIIKYVRHLFHLEFLKVPYLDVLGCLRFLNYINDLPDLTSNSKLFASDMSLFSTSVGGQT